MKTTSIIGIVAVMGVALVCTHLNKSGKEETLWLGDKVSFENLDLYPVLANDVFIDHRKNMAAYLSLKEAVELNKVEITEYVESPVASASQEPRTSEDVRLVNTLLIENTSSTGY